MHLPPRRVVANGHRGLQERSVRRRWPREVLGDAAQKQAVGHVDLFIEGCAEPRREHSHVDHSALDLSDPHELARPQHMTKGDDEAAARLADEAGDSQRKHQAYEYAQALERLAASAR